MNKRVALLVATGLVAGVASAHRPAVLKDRIEVDKPKVSWAYYGGFETGEEVFTVHLEFDEDFATPFEILVPHAFYNVDWRPHFALVGPGLPAPSDAQRATLPAEVPAGMGVFIEANDDPERHVFFEGFSRSAMWSSGAVALPLRAGKYEVWIWSPDRQVGEFTFAFGVEEDFSDGGWDGIWEVMGGAR